MTFRHTLVINFTDEATEEQKGALFDGLAKMPQVMEFIRRYEFGPDLGLREGNSSAALVADFDSEEDWREYSAHPDHLELVNNLFRPIVSSVTRVQYLVD